MSVALDTVRAFEAAWHGGDGEAAARYLADDTVLLTFGGETAGAGTVVQRLAGFMEIVSGKIREVAAVVGAGAFLNGARLRVGVGPRLKDAVVALGDYAIGSAAESENRLRSAVANQLANRALRVRMLGSAAIVRQGSRRGYRPRSWCQGGGHRWYRPLRRVTGHAGGGQPSD